MGGANSLTVGMMNHNMTSTGGAINHNYRTNTHNNNNSNNLGGANFGLGGLGSLANFGSYLGSGSNVKSHGNNLNTSGGSAGLIHHQ